MRECDDDPMTRANEPLQLVFGLGEPAGGDRRALGLERERLPARKGVELCRTGEVQRSQVLLVPHATHVVGLPDEIRRPGHRRDEPVGDSVALCHALVLDVARKGRLDEIGAPLRGGIHERALDGVQRPLCERREGAHLFDLVAEELDSQRLATGRREDVDDPASNRELTPFLDALHSLVTRQRHRFGNAVGTGLVADCEPDRLRALILGWEAIGECACRGADETAATEYGQGTEPLAHEMRGRLEPRSVRNPSARQQGDAVGADEPRDGLRRIACVCVLGQQHEQRAVELPVQRGEEEGKNGLRHTCPRRERQREAAKAFMRSELVDKGGERRGVHTSGGKRVPWADPSCLDRRPNSGRGGAGRLEGLAERRSSPGCVGRSEARTQGAR